MFAGVEIVGSGHSLGSHVVTSRETSLSLGLDEHALEDRTGIVTRRVCAPGESVIGLARQSIENALSSAGIQKHELGPETVLIYIENALTDLTPPAAIRLSRALDMPRVRSLSIDGVCSEPVHALEYASLLLNNRRCDQVIICAAADFLVAVDAMDGDTSGLFGAGSGSVVVRRSAPGSSARIEGLYWETDSSLWELGRINLGPVERLSAGFHAEFSYYKMKGTELARSSIKMLKDVIGNVFAASGWEASQIDHIVSHQPNPKLLQIGARSLGLPYERFIVPGRTLGNMGPASVLVAYSMLAEEQHGLKAGTKLLFLSFGLGLSCGCAALTL